MPPPSPPKTTANTGDDSSPRSKEKMHNRSPNDGNQNCSDDGENLGSGLATFFGDFLPYQNDTNDKPVSFSTELSRLPSPSDPIENSNHIESNVGIKYIDGGLLYSQWRKKEKERLKDYLMLRLHPRPDDEITQNGDSILSSSESSDEGEGEEVIDPESQHAMETQEPLISETIQSPDQGKSSRQRRKKISRRNIVPYVEDCLHDLTKLEFLDLHARTMSLSLSRIDKLWRLRDTKRSGALAKGSIRKPVFESCSPPTRSRQPKQLLQRLFFEEKEDDGPLFAIYKKVVHLEVQQLHISQAGGIGGVVGGPNDLLLSPNNKRRIGRTRFQQRIKVFFYNSYALDVSEWIKEQQKKSRKKRKRKCSAGTSTDITTATTDIVMSLTNIPAACIFPCAVDPRNWREKQDLVDYCLCIGDKSIAITRKNQQHESRCNENRIRFDSNEMEVRLMAVVTKTTTSQTTAAAGNIITNDVVNDVDASSELILSRRTLSKEFLWSSSSEENTPKVVEAGEEKGLQKKSNELTSPLQTSWESYQKNRGLSPNNKHPVLPNQREVTTNRQSASVMNEGPPRRQLNQRGQQQPQDRSTTKEQQSKVPRNGNVKSVAVEPMMTKGVIQRRSDSEDVNYVQIGEIANMVAQSMGSGRACNFKVNLYASVVGVTPPRITKRGDWMIAVTLIDESCPTPLTINIFCKKQDQLPNLIWMGDVVRIHRAAVENWYNKIQLLGLKPTQYVVIRKIERKWQVIPTAKNYFTFNRSDEERSQALWCWANKHASNNPSMKPEHCFAVEELQHLQKGDDEKTYENRDITVMVVQKLRYQSSDVLPHGLLRVWDGTGNPPSDPLFMPAKILNPLPEEQRAAAYPRAIEKVIGVSKQLQTSIHTMGIPISLCGRVSNVVIWEKSHWALIHDHIPVGTFLRLRNVHIPLNWESNKFRSIFMHNKSWMTALPTNNFEVRSLLYQHNERVRRGGNDAYNREFGGGPAALPHILNCKFVGTGLSNFRNQEKANLYTGAVHVLRFESSSTFYQKSTCNDKEENSSSTLPLVTLADRSGSFQAMVTQTIRRELQNLLPGDVTSGVAKSLDSNRRFLVKIRMIVLDGDERKKHFVLTNLARMD